MTPLFQSEYNRGMKLDRWLSRPGRTEEQFAAELRKCGLRKTNQSTLNRIRNGDRQASLSLALAIEAVTRGEVRAEELPLSAATRRALRVVRELGQRSLEERATA